MKKIFQKLYESDKTYYIQPDCKGNDRFDPNSNTVYWDPTSGLETTTGGRQSPALGLGHELAHAQGWDFNPDRSRALANTSDPNYNNAEERRVIVGPETFAANTLGEDVRTDHSGKSLPTVKKSNR